MHGSYKFALLDPRRGPQAEAANDRVFDAGPVYGVEVTVPALAERCVENFDPQHTGGDVSTAAIEVALVCELPPAGVTLATVRPDLDAFGTMAVLAMRADGVELVGDVRDRTGRSPRRTRPSRSGVPAWTSMQCPVARRCWSSCSTPAATSPSGS